MYNITFTTLHYNTSPTLPAKHDTTMWLQHDTATTQCGYNTAKKSYAPSSWAHYEHTTTLLQYPQYYLHRLCHLLLALTIATIAKTVLAVVIFRYTPPAYRSGLPECTAIHGDAIAEMSPETHAHHELLSHRKSKYCDRHDTRKSSDTGGIHRCGNWSHHKACIDQQ